jgi:hypothetical protein
MLDLFSAQFRLDKLTASRRCSSMVKTHVAGFQETESTVLLSASVRVLVTRVVTMARERPTTVR